MTNKVLIFTILLLSLLLNFIFIGRKVYYLYFHSSASVFTTRTSADLYSEIFRNSPNDSNEIIFLGNSITQAFNIQEFFPELTIKNRGISGNTTDDILNRINEISESSPQKVFLMIGINDLLNHIPVKDVLNNIEKIILHFEHFSPNTTVYVQSILPVTSHASDYFMGDADKVNEEINEINRSLEKLADGNKTVYINLNSYFMKDGELNESYSWDGIHINAEGYNVWLSLVRPYITNKFSS